MPSSSVPSAIPWRDSFAIGHEEMDRQHRQLADTINDIHGAAAAQDEAQVGHLIKALKLAAQEHFREEDAILWQMVTGTFKRRSSRALPRPRSAMTHTAFQKHTTEHTELLTALDNIAREPLESMIDRLKFWFVDHIVRQDSHLKAVFQAH